MRDLPRGTVNVPVLAAEDPAQAFLDGDLNTQRATVETLATVRLFPWPRGSKVNLVVDGEKRVNPRFIESVEIDFGDLPNLVAQGDPYENPSEVRAEIRSVRPAR